MSTPLWQVSRPAPRLAEGVRLLGEYEGSGFSEPHYLAVRGDEQVLHMSRLLHLVASSLDGDRSMEQVAAAVSTAYGRTLTAAGLAFLLEQRLRPLQLLAEPGTGAATSARPPTTPAPRADPLLALRLRRTLVPARWTRRIARCLAPLFHPLVVAAALVALVAGDAWLLQTDTIGSAFSATLEDPIIILGLLGVLLLSTLFHEFGHAAACHRGGAEPGSIGVAVYLVYPAFFTDVTRSYRLSRVGRLRTDLGGVYFNVLAILVLLALYARTGSALLLLSVVLVHTEMLQQLLPLARLDGYFVVADLVGVPDLFGRVGPVVRSLLHPGRPSPRVSELRPFARRVITAWVLVAVPVMLAAFGLLLWNAPAVARSVVAAEGRQLALLRNAVYGGQPPAAALAAVSMLLLPLPLVGLGLLVGGLLRRLILRAVAGRTPSSGARRARPRPQEIPMSGSKHAPVLPMMEPGQAMAQPSSTPPPPQAGGAATSSPGATPPAPPVPLARAHGEHLVPAPGATGLTPHEAALAHSAAEFTEEAMLRPMSRPPGRGWRRGVYAVTRGGVNLGPGAAERREMDLLGRVRTPVRGCRRIVVLSRKGGAGKTTTTLMLGHTLATYRGDRVIALDANPDAGSLAHRMPRQTTSTVTDLLRERDWIQRYADMRDFTSQAADTRLEVVASDDDPRISQALGEEDYRRAIEVLDRHYNLLLVDTGTGILDSAMQGILAEADQLVVVMPPALDGARVAAMTLDWLEEHGHVSLVRGAVAAVNAVHGAGQLELPRIEAHFATRCRAVVRIPWDPVLQAGAHTALNDLRQQTRDAYLELAAHVAGAFTQDRVPSRGGRS
ncbi:MinD/ParA family protein [Pedococcus sp. NPDC057267]|uniref:MinD/ParA family protein n=1 Tax=Pedococcus sp. NPDC057267 TaxID=3346077 RepID=UPI003636B26E